MTTVFGMKCVLLLFMYILSWKESVMMTSACDGSSSTAPCGELRNTMKDSEPSMAGLWMSSTMVRLHV